MACSGWRGRSRDKGLLDRSDGLIFLLADVTVIDIGESFLLGNFPLAALFLRWEQQAWLDRSAGEWAKAWRCGALNIRLFRAEVRVIRIGGERAKYFLAAAVDAMD